MPTSLTREFRAKKTRTSRPKRSGEHMIGVVLRTFVRSEGERVGGSRMVATRGVRVRFDVRGRRIGRGERIGGGGGRVGSGGAGVPGREGGGCRHLVEGVLPQRLVVAVVVHIDAADHLSEGELAWGYQQEAHAISRSRKHEMVGDNSWNNRCVRA